MASDLPNCSVASEDAKNVVGPVPAGELIASILADEAQFIGLRGVMGGLHRHTDTRSVSAAGNPGLCRRQPLSSSTCCQKTL